MAREVRASKLQTDTWRKSLDLATSLSEDTSRKQAGRISKLEEELRQARDEYSAAIRKFKDQKEAADAANKSVDEARKAVDELKKTVSTWDRAYQDLEAKMDLATAKVKLAEDTVAKERDTFNSQLTDGEDALVDTAMYRCWVHNPTLDLSFLWGEAEATVARWKVRLEDELLTLSGTAAGEEPGKEVTSKTNPAAGKTPNQVTKTNTPTPKI